MSSHVHLVGGAGRIGTALARSLLADPFKDLKSLSIYCDVTKANGLKEELEAKAVIPLQIATYSRFFLQSVIDRGWGNPGDHHIVCLHRGVNDKRFWLNQPLEAINIQLSACSCLLESDIPLHPNVSIVHLTSQLCDLLEGPSTVEDVCGGLESYRRPYIISRLHQEALLTAFAFQHSVPTSFVRLASVYGFDDQRTSPWIFTTLTGQWNMRRSFHIRNPHAIVYLTHAEPLVSFLRSYLQSAILPVSSHTIRYARAPMLPISVQLLANVIESRASPSWPCPSAAYELELSGDLSRTQFSVGDHLRLLMDEIDKNLESS